MTVSSRVLQTLRTWYKIPAGDLTDRLRISRATLMRAIQTLGPEVVARGKARRTAYAARRAVRGSKASIPLFRIDKTGRGTELASIDPIYPQGCAVLFQEPFDWPLPDNMRDGWFEGIPYPLRYAPARLSGAPLRAPERRLAAGKFMLLQPV